MYFNRDCVIFYSIKAALDVRCVSLAEMIFLTTLHFPYSLHREREMKKLDEYSPSGDTTRLKEPERFLTLVFAKRIPDAI